MNKDLLTVPRSKSRIVTVIVHVLVWIVFFVALFLYRPLTSDIPMPVQYWIKQAIVMALLVTAYYVNAVILVPRFLLKNHTAKYFAIIVFIVVSILLLNFWTDDWLHMRQVMDNVFHKHFLQEAQNKLAHKERPKHHDEHSFFDMIMIVLIALVVGISTSATAIQKWQHDQLLKQELEKDKVSSELSFLKAQINPHFFFNTLNNIYALTLINVDTSRQAIHQLSRMMRYLLYDTQKEQTLLSQEIALVKDYISLMQLRLTKAATVDLNIPENLHDKPIPPMIFLPFVENAFKHGISATQSCFVSISFTQENGAITMDLRNSIIKENTVSLDEGGIGLSNTRRRLDLIYPNKHELFIKEDTANSEYIVKLTINLS